MPSTYLRWRTVEVLSASMSDASRNDDLELVAIIGSLRAGSFNRMVFNAAMDLAPVGVRLTEVSVADVPLYNGDVEDAGDPEAVAALKSAVDGADGLVVFTPEYNGSIPAVTKNAIDWLSRMPFEGPLSRAIVGVVAATRGKHDCARVRGHLSDSLGGISKSLHDPSLGVASAGHIFDESGALTDPDVQEALGTWLGGFAEHVRNVRAQETQTAENGSAQ